MDKWIFLKSDNPADAFALATVLHEVEDTFYIVRRSVNSAVFEGLGNVKIGYYSNNNESQLFIIESIVSDSWQAKCDTISNQLHIETKSHYIPYLGFIKKNEEIDEMIRGDKNVLLYLFPHIDQKLDLLIIDKLVKLLDNRGYKFISGGSSIMPCIKGTKDLRELINFQLLCGIIDKIDFVVTSETFVKTIGEAINIKVYVLSDYSGMTIDNQAINDANEMANYITMYNK